ncbi:unnamed protein product [Echinostoma caproni]|uniref:Major facilitator superfamily domain-containing protein 12 n=1 Tax=Echinostoma caproni TaxID=27848 RepID=A0A183AE11_9TREM|nr:unnamed protein product [Echinostoma caproni]
MGLSWRVRLGYAIGHVLNDLCASVWFTYTLVYFKFGVGVPTVLAGTVVLLGQVADGLATPLVGFFSDKTSSSLQAHAPVHYQRAPNGQGVNGHLEHTVYSSESTSDLIQDVTIGWAAVQITHLAMMNDLTLEPGERTLLTSLRYLFTVLSNLAVYLCTFFLLHRTPDPEPPHTTESVNNMTSSPYPAKRNPVLGSHPLQNDVDFGEDDLPAFRNLSLAIVGVGGLVTILFHLCIRTSDVVLLPPTTGPTETTPLREVEMEKKSSGPIEHRIHSWRDWLRLPLFWVQGLFYMTVRSTVNVSQQDTGSDLEVGPETADESSEDCIDHGSSEEA